MRQSSILRSADEKRRTAGKDCSPKYGHFPQPPKSRAMNLFKVWEKQVEVPSDLERVL